MTLLLVDSAVVGYENIIAAAKSDVVTVVFDRYVDTFQSLKDKIAAAAPAAQVGIVQHGDQRAPIYKLLEAQVTPALIRNAETEDPSLESWAELKDFYGWLKSRGATTIDLISCALYANTGWVYVLQTLEQQLALDFRASINNTGNVANGGDWIQESDGVNIQTIYFTDAIQEYVGLLTFITYRRANQMVSIPGSIVNSNPLPYNIVSNGPVGASTYPEQFAVNQPVTYNMPVSVWGSTGAIAAPTSGNGLTNIAANSYYSFAGIRTDGSIVAWGEEGYGGSEAPTESGFVAISVSPAAFAALKNDGSIKAWGRFLPFQSASTGAPTGSGYVAIASTFRAFAALHSTGTIFAWGNQFQGGSGAPTGSGYIAIASNEQAFAAIRYDGSIFAWGGNGGTGAPTGTGFTSVTSTAYAFAALTSNGSIQAWGDTLSGGTGAPAGTGFTTICSSFGAFAALKSDGSITAWGNSGYGGSGGPTGTGFVAIGSTYQAFAALKSDGTIVAWGHSGYGGSGAPAGNGFVALTATSNAFAALHSTGTISAWGNSGGGGSGAPAGTNFISITSLVGAFIALKTDGSIAAWGSSSAGGSGAPAGTGFTFISPGANTVSAVKATVPSNATTAVSSSLTGNYVVFSTDTTNNVVLNTRAAIKNALGGSLKRLGRNQYVQGMIQRLGLNTNTIPSSSFSEFKNTLYSGENFLIQAKNIIQHFPTLNIFGSSGTLEISSFPTDNSVYVCLELPINIPVTLLENGTAVSNGNLFYDGFVVYRNTSATGSPLTAGSTITFGTKTINNIAFGSLTGNAGPLPAPPSSAPTIRINPQVSSSTLICYWTPDPTLVSYTVTVVGPGGSIQTVPATTGRATFTGLTNGTLYTPTIYATDLYNQNSPIATFRTVIPGGRPGPPSNVIFTQQGSTFQVTWSPPLPPTGDGGSPIQGYAIREIRRLPEFDVCLEPFRTSYESPPISPGTYTFQIAAVNYAGHGVPVFSSQFTF